MSKWKPDIKKRDKPLYIALAEALEHDINAGILVPGEKLPPQRELADCIGVNLSTVTRAFRLCELKGLIYGTVGRGTFVGSDVKISLSLLSEDKTQHMIEMGQVLPLYSIDKDTAGIAKKLIRDIDMEKLMMYTDPAGLYKHRAIGAEWLKGFKLKVSPEEILITPGSQNALAVGLLTLFKQGDRIAVDSLTYPGMKALAAMYGIRLIPIETTNEGMNPQVLVSACKNEGVKGVYLMPEVQNPTTFAMTENCRVKIADIIKKYELILLEDDAYNYTGRPDSIPLSALVPEQGIYIGGTSKLLGPGFRISFVRVPQAYVGAMKKGLLHTSWMASPITAEMVVKLIETGRAEAVLQEKRAEAFKRNRLAADKLSQFNVLSRPHGFFQWLLLPRGWQGRDFEICAREAGVQVFCAEKFAVGNGPLPSAVRISLSGPDTMEELEKGLDIIKNLLLKGYDNETIII